ncbi:SDR family oxidoreductase [Desulfosporosinus sp. FKA]|uniref:SDR family NAD(P)-dependent oxidoreductase n=1 Tax=Desulfosporosinus sp. FKA TaxID=1969834 RepID=UPI000B4998F7|nr:SDR family oxidoreductase [Desulfosporosinus sp. FKA]
MTSANLYTLVTGASSGIGRGIAQILSQNHNLILHGRNIEELERTKLNCSNSDNHLIWAYDLSDINHIEADLSTFLVQHTGHVNNFVHSAGVVHVMPSRLVSLQAAQTMMNINFFSAFELTKVLTKKKYNNGQLKNIIFVSSIYSKYGAKGQSIYCASKGALDSFMKSLAVELAPYVRVNSILPGAIKTGMSEKTFQNKDYINRLQEEYLLGFGDVTDIGNAVEFLLSDNARWVTGQQMIVDGGRTAH